VDGGGGDGSAEAGGGDGSASTEGGARIVLELPGFAPASRREQAAEQPAEQAAERAGHAAPIA